MASDWLTNNSLLWSFDSDFFTPPPHTPTLSNRSQQLKFSGETLFGGGEDGGVASSSSGRPRWEECGGKSSQPGISRFSTPNIIQEFEEIHLLQAFQYPTNSLSIVTSGGKKTAQVKDSLLLFKVKKTPMFAIISCIVHKTYILISNDNSKRYVSRIEWKASVHRCFVGRWQQGGSRVGEPAARRSI